MRPLTISADAASEDLRDALVDRLGLTPAATSADIVIATSSRGSGYGYSGYPYYGGSSLVIESSPTYVSGGGRPYYRPGGHYRPNYNHGYNRPNNVGRPGIQGSRPTQISPGSGAALGRPLGNSGGARPAPPPSRLTNDGRGRLFQR